MKLIGLIVCVVLAVVALSYAPADAGVYRLRSRSACSGVSTVREYSRGRSASCAKASRAKAGCSGGVSRSVVRSKRSCAG